MTPKTETPTSPATVPIKKPICSKWWLIFLLIVLIGCVGLCVVLVLFFIGGDMDDQYGIAMDCGSSHSEVLVYRWKGRPVPFTTADVTQIKSCNIEPGISSYEKTIPSRAGDSLNDCLNEAANSVIPAKKHKMTTIFAGATAGMRLVEGRNGTVSKEIMTAVSNKMNSYNFQMRGAEIISGGTEGSFGWISTNFLLNTLSKTDAERSRINTVGALDLGGASAQITFETSAPVPPEHLTNLKLYGQHYRVYSHSFLCHGMNEARRRVYELLVRQSGYNRPQLNHPCFNVNYRRNISKSDIYVPPCVKSAPPEALDRYEFVGTGDSNACRGLISQLIDKRTCAYDKCSFNNTYIPPLNGSFRAFSAHFYTAYFFNATNTTEENFVNTVKNFCSLEWFQAKTQYSDGPKPNKFLPDNCFSGNYVYQFLSDGYGFKGADWERITFVGEVNGMNVGWALGLMLNTTGHLPADKPVEFIAIEVFSPLAAIFSAFILIAIVLAGVGCYRLARKDQRREGREGRTQQFVV